MFADGYAKCDTHMHPNIIRQPQKVYGFIEKAIELGFDMICFTDHMPYPDYDADDRMLPGTVSEYCRTVERLAREYASQIAIKCGIEVDYCPRDEEYINRLLREGQFDHILGSTHFHLPFYGIRLEKTQRDTFADMALDNTLSCVRSGLFDTVSHMDFFRWAMCKPVFHFKDSEYHLEKHLAKIDSVIDEIEQTGVCLEINSSGIYKGFDTRGPHPEHAILDRTKGRRIRYLFGSDAHRAENVGRCYDEISRSYPVQAGVSEER